MDEGLARMVRKRIMTRMLGRMMRRMSMLRMLVRDVSLYQSGIF